MSKMVIGPRNAIFIPTGNSKEWNLLPDGSIKSTKEIEDEYIAKVEAQMSPEQRERNNRLEHILTNHPYIKAVNKLISPPWYVRWWRRITSVET